MTYLTLAALILAVAAAISFAIVPVLSGDGVQQALGRWRAGVLGVAVCAGIGIAGFWLADLDHLPAGTGPVPRFWEAATLTGFSAIFWLPYFLFSYSRQIDRKARP